MHSIMEGWIIFGKDGMGFWDFGILGFWDFAK
jgi:hypothetical protein